MKIDTQHEVDQFVYFMHKNLVVQGRVEEIVIKISAKGGKAVTRYKICMGRCDINDTRVDLIEGLVFKTKEALLASL